MVNTRHSINASHEDEDLKSVNGNCVKIAGKKIDKEEDLPLEVDKSQKGKKANELFESFNYDAIQRRSIRHQQRSLNHIGKSRRSLKHVPALRFASHGSSYVRRSDRRIKRVFETFNEQEIYRTIEKKHQEMLEMDQGSMYDVIKRRRGESDTQDDEDGTANEVEDSDGDDEEDEEDEEVELQPAYCLRKKKPKTNKYQAPINNGRPRRDILYAGSQSPLKIHHVKRIPQHSSPHHHCRRSRRSSSTSSSDDEARFERRKSKSMAISRARCLPMNFKEKDLVGILKDRSRAREESNLGSSLADVDPMTVDTKTSFADIGGLDKHIRSLKEMIVFPLLYPEVFAKFNITPPRGVLFYGPPGTGKTLVARALANECSRDGQKVAFFMRKGADCLSKWVGESERQLRLLFDQAYTMRPSIIFFDEIDGIAPVRSTRQDQIHSSIVSTLLALMDGLDARGEIVIIGATNRLDSIDPALRRPGRFDREFLFGLPDKFAREKILTIHTSEWQPKLSPEFIRELAEKCVGYCGADIKGLCTEAALLALRRRYPQIYETNKKLVLNTKEIKISSIDFKNAMKRITPASSRSSLLLSRALPLEVKPLLNNCVTKILELLNNIFPAGMHNNDSDESSCSENEDIFEHSTCNQRTSQITNESSSNYMLLNKKVSYKSHLLVYGHAGNGQSSYICPALLHSMEHLSSFNIDLPSIAGNSSRTPEEALSQIFLEARKSVPSIIYLPHIDAWFSAMSDVACATFLTLLNDTPADLPILLLSTAETNWYNLPEEIQNIFSKETQTFHVTFPSDSERYDYFKDTFLLYALKKSVKKSIKKEVHKEVLLEATPPKPRELSANEAMLLQETEEATLRELRVFLRQVTWKLLADRKFKEFSKPVDLEEVNDYLQVVKEPMDLSTVMTRINSHYYESCSHYLKDIDLIMNNCLEYNPDKDQFDKLLRNRACEMKDVANALIYADLDPEFEKLCLEISESRKKRGVKSNGPAFMKVMPQYKRSSNNVSNQSVSDINDTPDKNSIPDVAGTRFSHRVRGLNDGIDVDLNTLNMLEGRKRKFQTKKSFDKESEREVNSPAKQTKSQQSIGGEINESLTSVPEPFRNEKKSNTQVTELLRDSTSLLTQLVDGTKYWNIDRLERLYARLKHCIIQNLKTEDRSLVLKSLKDIVESIENK